MKITSIAKKAVVGVTGLGLLLFVLGHMVGNLQFFFGRETINRYGEFLHSVPELLWVARAGLIVFVILHIAFTIWLWRENQAARPVRYAYEDTIRASKASRTMLLSGLMVLLFIAYHLLHFTVQPGFTSPGYAQMKEVKATGLPVTQEPTGSGEGASAHEHSQEYRSDIYGMMYAGFSVPLISLVYIGAQLLLMMHLSHGATSLFRTLGWLTPKYEPWMKKVGPILSAFICAGFISIPIAVLADHYLMGGWLFNYAGLSSLGAK